MSRRRPTFDCRCVLSIAINGILRMPLFLITHFVFVFRVIGEQSLLFLLARGDYYGGAHGADAV